MTSKGEFSMPEYLGPLLKEKDEIELELRTRIKQFVEKSITAGSLELLEEKLKLEQKDGWELIRKNQNSFRLKIDKPIEEQLEDEVWSILAQVQFQEMSKGRLFKIQTDKDVEPRQIDVFAKDNEVAIFVECTCCENPKPKSMAHLIEKIESFRSKITKSLFSHYGRENKLKQGWVIATRNIEWSTADLEKARVCKITVLKDSELNYYKKFTRLYKLAAKYQLLSHIFANEVIHGLDLVVPATKGSMGGVDFYNFLIKPAELLKISHVSHKASRDVQDIETYQRMLQPKRLKELATYIDNGGQFPTNIVVNIRSKSKLRFEQIGSKGDSGFGNLTLPNKFASAMIIDGQHRLYGFAHSQRLLGGKETKSTVPVLAYENLPATKEAKLFVDINCEQVRVNKNLLKEIHATLYWDSDNFDLRIDALCSRLVMRLSSKGTSPFFDRIKMTNKDQTDTRCLTLTNFTDSLKENKFFGEDKKSGVVPGPLSDSSSADIEKTLIKSVEIIDGYFDVIKQYAPSNWALGNKKKEKENIIGYLATNEGVRALLRVLKEILTFIENQTGIDNDNLSGSELLAKIVDFAKPIAEVFESASFDTIQQFRARTGQVNIKRNSTIMQSFIHRKFPDFSTGALSEYLENIDEEGTKEAKELVGQVVRHLHKFVIYKLKEKYTKEKEWWWEGVPATVRKQCTERHDAEKGIKEPEQYFTTVDYLNIAAANWQGCFEPHFSFTKEGGKENKLKWIKELSAIRNITHHEEKWPATKDQVAFVRDIHKKVFSQIHLPGDV